MNNLNIPTKVTPDLINQIYAQCSIALAALKAAERQLHAARHELEDGRATNIRNGVEGRNQAERDANLRYELVAEFEAVYNAEQAVAEARLAHDLARIERQRLDRLIDLARLGGVTAPSEYMILSNWREGQVESMVRDKLAVGWRLHGSLQAVPDVDGDESGAIGTKAWYAQAVVR